MNMNEAEKTTPHDTDEHACLPLWHWHERL